VNKDEYMAKIEHESRKVLCYHGCTLSLPVDTTNYKYQCITVHHIFTYLLAYVLKYIYFCAQ